MDWQSGRRSDNVEDRRGSVGRKVTLSGGAVVLIVVVGALLGKSPGEILQLLGETQRRTPATTTARGPGGGAGVDDVGKDFVRSVLGSTEDVWGALLRDGSHTYRRPKLVLFRGGVDSACGFAESAVGPFYCPGDEQVYLDLDFFDELDRRFRAPGEFARAYVIAHEVGHHVQHLLGWGRRSGRSAAEKNAASVRAELQADCLAGVWAFHAQRQRPFLEEGDLESALGAASAIGDDRLQKQARGYVVPESFTHGTSAQRMKWFKVGFDRGGLEACDTSATRSP
jgi:hypothetical protein